MWCRVAAEDGMVAAVAAAAVEELRAIITRRDNGVITEPPLKITTRATMVTNIRPQVSGVITKI